MAASEPMPGNPAGPTGGSPGRSGTAATFQVDDSSLRSLHTTVTTLVKDFGLLNAAILQVGKSSGSLTGLSSMLGGGSVTGSSGAGGGSQPLGGDTKTTRTGGGGSSNGGDSGFTGSSAAAQAQQGRGRQKLGLVGLATRGAEMVQSGFHALPTSAQVGVGALAAGAGYINSKMGNITALDSMYVSGAQMAGGGYAQGNYQAARGFTNSLGGYNSAQDLTAGVSSITAMTGGGILDPRTQGVMRSAGNLASLNPSAGFAGSASAASSLYAPQVQNQLRAFGMSPQASGGALQSPTATYQSILQRSFGNQKITSAMVNQGMQPGSPLYQTLSTMGLSPQAMQQFQQYGNAVVNSGGNYSTANTAMSQAAAGKTTSLTKQAGLSASIMSQQNKAGRASTQAQSETTSEAAGGLKQGFDLLSDATTGLTKAFQGLSGMTNNIPGHVAGAASILTPSAKTAGATAFGLLNVNALKGAAQGALTGGVGGALKGGISGGIGGSGMEGTPVWVTNWPGGGMGGFGGGSGGSPLSGLAKKLKIPKGISGKGISGLEGAAEEGSAAESVVGGAAGLEGTGAVASGMAGLGGTAGLAGMAAAAPLALGAAGFIAGNAISDIGKHNGKKNKAARLIGDTAAGTAAGAAIGSVVPVVGTAVGAAIGGGIGFFKGGGVGESFRLQESVAKDIGGLFGLGHHKKKKPPPKATGAPATPWDGSSSGYGADGRVFNSVYASGQYASPMQVGAGQVSIGVGQPGGSATASGGGAGNSSSSPSTPAGNPGEISKAIQVAESFVGQPYKWGGSNPKTSFDCIAEGTLITTDRGDVPIEDVVAGDRVLTRKGYRRVLAGWLVRENAPTVDLVVDGRVVRGTADHRVWTENRGWVALAEVTKFDTLVSCRSRSGSSSTGSPTTGTPSRLDRRCAPTSSGQEPPFTEPSGRTLTGQSHQGTRSTTATMTRSTTGSRTSSASRRPTTGKRVKRRGNSTITSALCVGRSSGPTRPASRHDDSARVSTSRSTTMTSTGPAARVYDLMVEGEHEFFANGVLVHNCSGLTQWSWGQAGVKLPRTAAQQQQVGTNVPLNQLLPGDLLFYGQPAEHVTMYVGNGQMVEAPHTGADIRVTGYRTATDAKRVVGGGAAITGSSVGSSGASPSGLTPQTQQGNSGTGPFGAGAGGANLMGSDEMSALAAVLAPPSLYGAGPTINMASATSPGQSASGSTAAKSTGSSTPPAGPTPTGTVGDWIKQAFSLMHLDFGKYGSDIATIIQHESSGNPKAINNWDSNAKAGHPSEGIMQTIPSTFAQYSLPGHKDIWNPVDNIVAATRYGISRYGSIGNIPGIKSLEAGQGYKGYASGAYKTAEGPAYLHSDEMVVPAQTARKVRAQIASGSSLPAVPTTGSSTSSARPITFQVTATIGLSGAATTKDASDFLGMVKSEAEKNFALQSVGTG